MAIVADLIAVAGTVMQSGGFRADAIELPPKKVWAISAAGFTDITGDAEVFMFHNLTTSQTVSIRLNVDSDNTAASVGDSQSVRVDPGETLAFGLPVNLDATAYKLSVV